MAGGKVKKGFFFYLLMFLILIVAFVGVCMTIMLFNPGKSVLGFVYFKNNKEILVEKTTDSSETAIDFSKDTFSTINVDAGNVDVIVQNNDNYKKSGLYIINNTKGFVKSSDQVEFEYSVEKSGDTLNIKLNSTRGFLNLSNDVKLIIHYGKIKENKLNSTTLNITTTAGSVNIGGAYSAGHSADIYPASVNIETGSGNVSFTRNATNIYKELKIKTDSGSVDLTQVVDKINPDETRNDALKATTGDINISTKSGTIDLKKVASKILLSSETGTIRATEISASTEFKTYSSIIDIVKISGNVDFSNGSEIMSSCKVYIDEITGNLNVPQARDSEFTIKKISGHVNIHATNGNISLGTEKDPLSKSVYVETVSGNVSTYLTGSSTRFFKTEKGNISLNYPTEIRGYTSIETDKGTTNVVFGQDSAVKFEFRLKNETEDNKFDLGKVSFDILNGKKLSSNPYYYNSNEGNVKGRVQIVTNSGVNLDLA